jgi:hypothetical protein
VFSTASRPVEGFTPSPVQWILFMFRRGQSGRVMKLTTLFLLVPRLRTRIAIPLHGAVLNELDM